MRRLRAPSARATARARVNLHACWAAMIHDGFRRGRDPVDGVERALRYAGFDGRLLDQQYDAIAGKDFCDYKSPVERGLREA